MDSSIEATVYVERSKNMNTRIMEARTSKETPTQFAFPAPAARHVSLAADFNNWDCESMPMRKGLDGVWRKNVPLEPGHHEYRFVADGVWQDDPAAEQRIANALGTENCVRTVGG